MMANVHPAVPAGPHPAHGAGHGANGDAPDPAAGDLFAALLAMLDMPVPAGSTAPLPPPTGGPPPATDRRTPAAAPAAGGHPAPPPLPPATAGRPSPEPARAEPATPAPAGRGTPPPVAVLAVTVTPAHPTTPTGPPPVRPVSPAPVAGGPHPDPAVPATSSSAPRGTGHAAPAPGAGVTVPAPPAASHDPATGGHPDTGRRDPAPAAPAAAETDPVAGAVAAGPAPAAAPAAPAAEVAAVAAPTVASTVAAQAAALHARDGGRVQLVLRVDPPQLGPVTVALTVHDDAVQLAFVAPDQAGAAALDAQRDAVRAALESSGLQLEQFTVAADAGRQPGPQDGRRGDARPATRPGVPTPVASTAARQREGVWL